MNGVTPLPQSEYQAQLSNLGVGSSAEIPYLEDIYTDFAMPVNTADRVDRVLQTYADFYFNYIHKREEIPGLIQNLKLEICEFAPLLPNIEKPELVVEFTEGIVLENNLPTLLLLNLFMCLGPRLIEEQKDKTLPVSAVKLIQNDGHRVTPSTALRRPPGRKRYDKVKTANDYLHPLGLEIVCKGHSHKTVYWLQKKDTVFKNLFLN